MRILYQDGPPFLLDGNQPDLPLVAEPWEVKLSASYSWSYVNSDERIAKLYRLAKERAWNSDLALDWGQTFPRSEAPTLEDSVNPFRGWAPYDALDQPALVEFLRHMQAWMLSQILHGEQAALLVACQLACCAPTHDAKLFAASQAYDEARHVEVFSRYLQEKLGLLYPVNARLKQLLDRILQDRRWDIKFIGMQLIIESVAQAAFGAHSAVARDPLLRQLLGLVSADESRHVAFGLLYLREHYGQLSAHELAERAAFAIDACALMREQVVAEDVFAHFGWEVAEGRRRFLYTGGMGTFRNLLFSRIVPNLRELGLITPEIRPRYEELALLDYVTLAADPVLVD
jgi:hypothetical protein